MKVPTNLVRDSIRYYTMKLTAVYPEPEAQQMIFWLVEDFFGFSRSDLALNPAQRLTESEMLQLHFAVKELLQHKPIQYVTGKAWFWGRMFKIGEEVLIPRPETELLVQEVVKSAEKAHPQRILDIGTGSGCIAVSLSLQFPSADVLAMDISEHALKTAEENAHDYQARVSFLKDDILNPQLVNANEMFDVIVSNPPYVSHAERQLMRKNVLDWEPHLALFVPDEDSLIFYRAIAVFAFEHLVEGGFIALELNEHYAHQTAMIFEKSGFKSVTVKKDIHEKDRVLTARR